MAFAFVRRAPGWAAVWFGVLSTWSVASAIDTQDTLMLSQPAASPTHVAFVYADDLWVADLDGKNPRRLTANPGAEVAPVFSPDGKILAFTGNYDGNTDVYTIPIEGGIPKRITHHPATDVARGFTPDGKQLLFVSPRHVFTRRHNQFFTVGLNGGQPTQLVIPYGWKAQYSPDGKKLVYTPVREVFDQWKNYRGGTHSRVWIFDLASHAVEEIPQPKDRCNDTDPYFVDNGTIIFRSDRQGEFNLFTYALGAAQKGEPAKAVRQVTRFADFPVLELSVNGKAIVFEQAARLHRLSFDKGVSAEPVSEPIRIGIAADLMERRPRYVKGSDYVRSAHISPSAARAVIEVRGEIVTVPAEKGDPRNLTNSTSAHDRAPAWSPDGKTIAYFSDASGDYQLHLQAQDGKSPPKAVKLPGSGFYSNAVWSRDSKKLAFKDNAGAIHVLDIAAEKIDTILPAPRYGSGGIKPSSWSPDSQWLAYTEESAAQINNVFLYSFAQKKAFQVTDGLSETGEPVFEASGKYLFFSGSTDSGLSKHSFMQSSQDSRRPRQSLYVALLSKDQPNPFAPESDEEKPAPATPPASPAKDDDKEKSPEIAKAGKENADSAPSKSKADKDDEKNPDTKDGKRPARTREELQKMLAERRGNSAKVASTKIDVDGIANRILSLPLGSGNYMNLQGGPANQLFYIEMSSGEDGGRRGPGGGRLAVFDMEKRRADTKLPAVSTYVLTPDGRKILYAVGNQWFINGAGPSSGGSSALAALAGRRGGAPSPGGDSTPSSGGAPGDKRINLDAISIKMDPLAEWPQIYAEAWRINRDFFYAPNMHGADWTAMKAKYEPFLAHCATRNDVNRVIKWLCSELAVGHHRGGGGDRVFSEKTVGVGLLGADYEVADNRFRFKKVYGGLNWSPDLRAPLTAPGVNVKAGEYLLRVNGQDVTADQELYAAFENTNGKRVELLVGPKANGENARTVVVEPISFDAESSLRNRDWVEGNLKKVHEATKGRVAYVYVPDTGPTGLTYFKRYFFPQVDKEAVIVDERFNAGGQIADYYIDLLRKPFAAYFAPRHGADWLTPSSAIYGPKVMIIDENAGSGGDMLPWMFSKFAVGPLVGKRTWGGLVGVSGYPTLMDGGSITAPSFAIWSPDGGWIVENEGVAPDIEVEQWPTDLIKGRDPQLEKAIELALAALEKNPPQELKPQRPPYPVRALPGSQPRRAPAAN